MRVEGEAARSRCQPVPCQPWRTESLDTHDAGVAQAAAHVTTAVAGRPSDAHTQGWCIDLAWA